MADEREQGRLRECEAMGHVWPKRPQARPRTYPIRFYSTPADWRQGHYEHVEWSEACERCGKTAEVSVFLCEAGGVELLRGEADVGMLVDDDHKRFGTPSRALRGVVSTLGPMKVVMRWGLTTMNYQPRTPLLAFMAALERAQLGLDWCNSLDQRWGPWRLECGPTWPLSLVVSDHAGERILALDPAEVERDMQGFRAYVSDLFARHVHNEAPTGEPPGPNSLAGEG